MPPLRFDDPIDVVLRDGSTVTIRSVRPADRDGLLSLADRLGRATLYTRFFDVPRPAADEVASLLHARPEDQLVLVAESSDELLAVGTYTLDPVRRAHAEVTVAVAADARGRGVGTRMLETLADHAARHRVDTFDAYLLPGNHPEMQVFLDSGYTISRHDNGGVVHLALSLAATAAQQNRSAERSMEAAAASMKAVFEPRGVVLIGASRERGKIGSEVLHNLVSTGYTGQLALVHPTAASIESVQAYPRITDVPFAVDLAIVCVPAAQVLAVVDDCIARGVKALVVISAGFGETGAEGRAEEARLVAKIREAGIRMVGPNCMGLLNMDPAVRLNATFSPVAPPPGRVAMSTQSGALGLAILDYARRLNIGFSTFVSVGNKADVSSNDLLQYWADDANTDVIVLYLESFGNPRKFSQIARRVARQKPIVVVKAGRSTVGARAASSHTGALASSDAIVDALFRQCGVTRTTTMEELFDVSALLSNQPIPAGRRVAILTNAGGPGILAADACEAQGLELPALGEASLQTLRSFLLPAASLSNPIDIIASATAEHFGRALTTILADDRIDSVLVIFIPPMVTKGDDVARAVRAAAATRPDKPVLAIFMSTEPAPPMLAPIPCFTFPEAAAVALGRATAYGEWRRSPEGTVPTFPDIDAAAARGVVDAVLSRGGGWATAEEGQTLLAAAGISAARATVAATEDDAVAVARTLGFPLAIKAAGPRIVHKTELKAVLIGIDSVDGVRQAWRDLQTRLGDMMTGVLVQQMVPSGVEMLVGSVDDPMFGPVIACASGGKLTEILADSQFRLQPLTDLDAAAMIRGLRCAALLRGYRGAAPADEAALQDALLRLSALIGICPDIRELDINPLTVLAQGVRAVDVRVRIEPARPRTNARRVQY